MKVQRIENIPISEIRIVNPRSRNKITFQSITANIGSVGLKKPITVHRRAPADDGTTYDLVCGQGRLEAVAALGDTTIPAIISEAPQDERYLMSLVENLARRQPRTTDLLREVRRLKSLHYKPVTIAEKLGLDKSYIYGVFYLLQHGADDLVARVEAGRLPIDTAVKIETGTEAEVQLALSDAYESGALRGAKLRAIQELIARRKVRAAPRKEKEQLSANDLVRLYERHTHEQRSIVRRSEVITERLALLTSSLRCLMSDDHFRTLLRAEGLTSMPEQLATAIAAPK